MITRFAEDEANTETKTILMMKIGGYDIESSRDIHWHVDPGVEIRYRSDPTREEIYEVEFTNEQGEMKHFSDRRAPEEGGEWRMMDCVDCHNRPSHRFYPPEIEVDRVLLEGQIDPSLPRY